MSIFIFDRALCHFFVTPVIIVSIVISDMKILDFISLPDEKSQFLE